MERKKRRSSIRKPMVDVGPVDIKSQLKKRISFSGKNSVRVFHGEEEPKTWNNSYEISDHLNANETSNLCGSPFATRLQSVNALNHKDNVQSDLTQQMLQVRPSQKESDSPNLSINNNISALSLTKDLINVSYQNQSSKIYQIENSVDITLCEKEKEFQKGTIESIPPIDSYSFLLEDREPEDLAIVPGERTSDFMRKSSNVKTNEKDREDEFYGIISNKSENLNIPANIYMNDSLSISGNGQISSINKNADKGKKTHQTVTMQMQQCDKENVNPFSAQNANETQNNISEMEIDDQMFLPSQTNDVNIEREAIAFQNKLNQLSSLEESDDNKQTSNSLKCNDVKLNNQSIIGPIHVKNKRYEENMCIQTLRSRPTINFNMTIDFSPNKTTKNFGEQLNINFNQSIENDIQTTIYDENNIHDGMSKMKSRQTSYFNKTIKISPPRVDLNVSKGKGNLKEDKLVSTVKLSHECLSDNNLNIPGNICKYNQRPKLIVRKICTPLLNKTETSTDLQRERCYENKKEEVKEAHIGNLNKSTLAVGIEKPTEKSLNFSLDSVKSMSLESESEFNRCSMMQLNDEIECGKIKVFSNASKVVKKHTDRKRRISGSDFHSKNVQLSQTKTKQKNALPFDDMDITLPSDNTLPAYLKSDKSKKFKQKINNAECCYSQADDIMPDNTSFLTGAKPSETVLRNGSKVSDIMNIFNESVMQAANKVEDDIVELSSKAEKSCNTERLMILRNAKPILIQNISNTTRDYDNYMDLCHSIHISTQNKEAPDKLQTEECTKQCRQTIYFDSDDITENDLGDSKAPVNVENVQTSVFHSGDSIEKDPSIGMKASENDETDVHKKSLYFNDYQADILPKKFTHFQDFNVARKTLYFNNDICELEKTLQSTSTNSIHIDKDTNETLNEDKSNISSKTDAYSRTSNTTRKTLYFNSQIPLDEEPVIIAKKIHSEFDNKIQIPKNEPITNEKIPLEKGIIRIKEHSDVNTCNLNPTRKTYFNDDITSENISMEIIENTEVKDVAGISYENKVKNKELSLERDALTINKKNTNEKCNIDLNLRKTIYFNNDICELEETLKTVDEKASQPMKSVNMEELVDFTLVAVDRNKCDFYQISADKSKVPAERKNMNTSNCIETQLNEKESYRNSKYNDFQAMNLMTDDVKPLDNVDGYKNNNQRTLFSENDSAMSLEQSFKSADELQFAQTAEDLSILEGQISGNHFVSISKSEISYNKPENLFMTPMKCADSNIKNPSICITPRLSLLEFTELEKEATEGEHLRSTKYKSQLLVESLNKSDSTNPTPVFSIPKIKQNISAIESDSKIYIPTEKSSYMEQIKENEKTEMINKGVSNDDAIEISTTELQITQKEKKSRIPILVSSINKSNNRFTNSNNYKETNLEDDDLNNSIQLIRRATTFTQKKDSTIGQIELDTEFVPAGKFSIFESNPITISDVSVFFEAHRKCTSDIMQNDMSLALEKTDTNMPNPQENSKNNLENRYINLTLEDIDKTRLSLVQISNEYDTVNLCGSDQEDINIAAQSLPNDAIVNEKSENENTVGLKTEHHNANYLRNTSPICRKCKRCEETLINETTSSTSPNITLPVLSHLPDIGLDRLKRLRKLPTIADVNSLWQRVSLDRTIVNSCNITDADNQIMCNLDEEAEGTIAKFIQEYEKDMMIFERNLLDIPKNKACLEKLPLFLRLNTILRANSTNWIFDHRMQCRGIFLFTHKKMLTFTLLLSYDEVDPLGKEIDLKCVKMEKGYVSKKNWKPIDFVLDFQLKLNLPYNLQWLLKGSKGENILNMLQEVDRVCLDTVKVVSCMLQITLSNQAYIKRDQWRTYIQKTVRKIVKNPNTGFKYVEKIEIQVEILNIKKLSFKDIISPRLHHFREEIHLLPIGLEFLQTFLPNPLNYLKDH